jgi:hypothetical protein
VKRFDLSFPRFFVILIPGINATVDVQGSYVCESLRNKFNIWDERSPDQRFLSVSG